MSKKFHQSKLIKYLDGSFHWDRSIHTIMRHNRTLEINDCQSVIFHGAHKCHVIFEVVLKIKIGIIESFIKLNYFFLFLCQHVRNCIRKLSFHAYLQINAIFTHFHYHNFGFFGNQFQLFVA